MMGFTASVLEAVEAEIMRVVGYTARIATRLDMDHSCIDVLRHIMTCGRASHNRTLHEICIIDLERHLPDMQIVALVGIPVVLATDHAICLLHEIATRQTVAA